jgi:hypothetical protein
MKIETCYGILARELYNKALTGLMHSAEVNDTIISISKEIARTRLIAIYNNSSKNDNQTKLYNRVMEEINNIVI